MSVHDSGDWCIQYTQHTLKTMSMGCLDCKQQRHAGGCGSGLPCSIFRPVSSNVCLPANPNVCPFASPDVRPSADQQDQGLHTETLSHLPLALAGSRAYLLMPMLPGHPIHLLIIRQGHVPGILLNPKTALLPMAKPALETLLTLWGSPIMQWGCVATLGTSSPVLIGQLQDLLRSLLQSDITCQI